MPAQYAALAAIRQAYDGELRQALEANRNLLAERAGELSPVSVWPTAGAFYSFWDVRACFGRRTPAGDEIVSSDDMASYLLREAGVITASGSGFLQDGFLRISFSVPGEELASGITAAAEALAALS